MAMSHQIHPNYDDTANMFYSGALAYILIC